jgi:hypothetical protein
MLATAAVIACIRSIGPTLFSRPLSGNRPSWVVELDRKLGEAAFAASGWPSSLPDAEVLERLLVLNCAHAALQR